jgi:hypothetical protein
MQYSLTKPALVIAPNLLIAIFIQKIYFLSIERRIQMDRKELINTLNILKNDKSKQKGFSLRRTLKTLHDYKRNRPVIDFWFEIQKWRD